MNITYHTYTVADVRAWLYGGAQNGLSECIISKVRANAIIHNPYVEDDMVIVVSATDGDKVVGFTAMFPDNLIRPQVRLSCPTTLYADADYAGEFIGYNVTKLLHETANGRMVIGLDMAKEAAIIDYLLGMKVEKVAIKRYIFNRRIHIKTLHDVGISIIELYRRNLQKRNITKFLHNVSQNIYVEYTDFIDEEAYRFIVAHSEHDMFLRSQEMLNWRLRYPFTLMAPMCDKVVKCNLFCSNVANSRRKIVAKVYENGLLVGIYCIAENAPDASVALLYVEESNATKTYDMLLTQVLRGCFHRLLCFDKKLNHYIDSLGICIKSFVDKYDYTHPEELTYTSDMQIQGMDGDMLAW